MQIEIKKLSAEDPAEWNDFLLQRTDTLLYVSYQYLFFLEQYLQAECYLTIGKDQSGERLGVFPFVIKKTPAGAVCNSLPYYGSNGGIIVHSAKGEEQSLAIRKEILRHTLSFIEQFNLVSCTLISNPLDPAGNDFLKSHFTHDLTDERIGQITHLPAMSPDIQEVLIKQFEDPRPRNIRKAIKSGIKVYASNKPEDLEFLYEVHYQNITSIGGRAKRRDFFNGIPSFFPDDAYKVYVAELEGKKIAALLLFYFNKTVEYFTPAVIEAHRDSQPTALIIYQAMVDAIKRGYSFWNWGGTWLTQGGVYDFKKRWGTTDHPYFYYIRVYDDQVYSLSKETLNSTYEYFYVIPFNKLNHPVK